MICKTFKYGTGNRGVIEYLLNERTAEGTAKVLKGNSEITRDLIYKNKNKQKYTSGVLSFEENELALKSKLGIIADFEKTFFPGMEDDQYNILWVEHSDKNRVELHFVIPKLELKTGLAYNPYFAKKDFNKKDMWQDCINHGYELTCPHETDKQLASKPQLKWAGDKISLSVQIDKYVLERLQDGTIQNRSDIIICLEAAGAKINRIGTDYLGIEIDGHKIRLKGNIYGKDFTSFRELAKSALANEQRHTGFTQEEYRRLREKLNGYLDSQAAFNRRKYKERSTGHRDGYLEGENLYSREQSNDRGADNNVHPDLEKSHASARWRNSKMGKPLDNKTTNKTKMKVGKNDRARNNAIDRINKERDARGTVYRNLRENTARLQARAREFGAAEQTKQRFIFEQIGRIGDKIGRVIENLKFKAEELMIIQNLRIATAYKKTFFDLTRK